MADMTTKFKLVKPTEDEFYDIGVPNDNMDIIDTALGDISEAKTAGGTEETITLSIPSITEYRNLQMITFVAIKNNSGVATTININGLGAKPLYKPNSTTSPTITTGKAYTVWYSSAGNCFFVKASASGNASKDDVLAGKIVSTDEDTDIVGTMPNNGAVNVSLSINGSYTVPKGYHDGSGKVSQSITTKGATTYTPTTTDQTIASGQYLSGAQTIKGDANLVPSKVLLNNTIFGVTGTGVGVNNCAQISGLASTVGFSTAGQITLNWTNPTDGLIKGVRILYKTGSYPTSPTDGTVFYDSNDGSIPTTATLTGLTEGTTYYIRAFAYTYQNATRLYTTTTTGAQCTAIPYRVQGTATFTASGSWTAPYGVTSVQIFAVGGGGAGIAGGAVGGGGGYAVTQTVAVTAGNTYPVTVGAGGNGGNGGSTIFGSNLVVASGGNCGGSASGTYGNGGSGGGGPITNNKGGGDGGSDGTNGYDGSTNAYNYQYSVSPPATAFVPALTNNAYGRGQGTTTRAWATAGQTLYSGGGAGYCGNNTSTIWYGNGGSGGGGNGGVNGSAGTAGATNTGGGGGNGGSANTAGGSGMLLLRWGY